jgi:hypothetical protein
MPPSPPPPFFCNEIIGAYGWTSNNSIYAELGMDYEPICERIRINGEPGFAWLDNMRAYGRMNGIKDHKDWRVSTRYYLQNFSVFAI